MLIAIEGIDGSGKTTIAKKLATKLNFNYINFPTNSFKNIKRFLKGKEKISKENQFLLFLTDIAINTIYTKNCVLDRYVYSTLAYQNDLFSLEEAKTLFEKLKLKKPDYVIYLDVDIEVALNRINKRKKKKSVFENTEFLKKVKKEYEIMYENQFFVFNRWVKINTNGKNVNQILDEIMKEINSECLC